MLPGLYKYPPLKAQSLPPKKMGWLSPFCSQEDIVVLGMDKCVQAPVTSKAMDHFQNFANADPFQSLAVVAGSEHSADVSDQKLECCNRFYIML